MINRPTKSITGPFVINVVGTFDDEEINTLVSALSAEPQNAEDDHPRTFESIGDAESFLFGTLSDDEISGIDWNIIPVAEFEKNN